MDFIPQAEESGMILPIGDWGLAEACNQIQAWNHEDPLNNTLRVCVNLSARQFSRQGLADHVESLLLQSGSSSRQLGLEMTESSLIPNMNTALRRAGGLRALGVSLLMDDFGTGYSSLNHLHSFPFDVLKIDRSFVGRMTDGDQPLQIVRTIIELARVLGMDVVAEGIETSGAIPPAAPDGLPFRSGLSLCQAHDGRSRHQLLRLPGRILPDPEELDRPLPVFRITAFVSSSISRLTWVASRDGNRLVPSINEESLIVDRTPCVCFNPCRNQRPLRPLPHAASFASLPGGLCRACGEASARLERGWPRRRYRHSQL